MQKFAEQSAKMACETFKPPRSLSQTALSREAGSFYADLMFWSNASCEPQWVFARHADRLSLFLDLKPQVSKHRRSF